MIFAFNKNDTRAQPRIMGYVYETYEGLQKKNKKKQTI